MVTMGFQVLKNKEEEEQQQQDLTDGNNAGESPLLLLAHDLVFIYGLKSDAGKTLNDGLGVIIKQPNTTDGEKKKDEKNKQKQQQDSTSKPPSSASRDDDDCRYPVRIFATICKKKKMKKGGGTRYWDILHEPMDRQLKPANVVQVRHVVFITTTTTTTQNNSSSSSSSSSSTIEECSKECFDQAASKYVEWYDVPPPSSQGGSSSSSSSSTTTTTTTKRRRREQQQQQQQERKSSEEKLGFWLKSSYKIIPGSYKLSIRYAHYLAYKMMTGNNDNKSQQEDAAEICLSVDSLVDLSSTKDWDIIWKCVRILTDTESDKYLVEAGRLSLKVPTNTIKDSRLAIFTSHDLGQAFMRSVYRKSEGSERRSISELYVQLLEVQHRICPDHVTTINNLAGAYSLAGRYWDSVRWYHKVFDDPDLSRENATDNASRPGSGMVWKLGIIVAQMQCPGMPLENHVVHSYDMDEIRAVPKDNFPGNDGDGTDGGEELLPNTLDDDPENFIHFPMPSDIHDPIFAPLLERLRQAGPVDLEEEEEE